METIDFSTFLYIFLAVWALVGTVLYAKTAPLQLESDDPELRIKSWKCLFKIAMHGPVGWFLILFFSFYYLVISVGNPQPQATPKKFQCAERRNLPNLTFKSNHDYWDKRTFRKRPVWLMRILAALKFHKLGFRIRFHSATWKWYWHPRTCSFCGSVHPEDAIRLIEEGWEVDVAKQYKFYLNPPGYQESVRQQLAMKNPFDKSSYPKGRWSPVPPVKAYLWHFTKEQMETINGILRERLEVSAAELRSKIAAEVSYQKEKQAQANIKKAEEVLEDRKQKNHESDKNLH